MPPRKKKEQVVEQPVFTIDSVITTATQLLSELEGLYTQAPKAEIGSAINSTDVLIRSLKASVK